MEKLRKFFFHFVIIENKASFSSISLLKYENEFDLQLL